LELLLLLLFFWLPILSGGRRTFSGGASLGLRTAAVFCLFCHATTHTSQANEDYDKEEERLQGRDPRKILWSLLLLQQQQSRCENFLPTREGLGLGFRMHVEWGNKGPQQL
jgi:hypothetical protein